MPEYVVNEKGESVLVHQTAPMWSPEWLAANDCGCNGDEQLPAVEEVKPIDPVSEGSK